MARDPKKTGASSGTGLKFIKILTKEAKFETPDGRQEQGFSGYLDRVDMEFRDPDNAHDLPARWEVRLVLTAWLADDDPAGDGGKYTIGLSSHWNSPLLANIVNGLAGAMKTEKWIANPDERFVRIWLSLKTPVGKRPYCSGLIFGSDTKGDYLPNAYPWNEAKGQYDNVPNDMEEARIFWLGVAQLLVKNTGGVIVGADTASIKLPLPVDKPATTAAPATAAATKTIADRAKDYFNSCIAAGDAFVDAVQKTFAAATKNGANENDLRILAGYCTENGIRTKAIPWGYINHSGEWVNVQSESPEKGINTNVVANDGPPSDDLPF